MNRKSLVPGVAAFALAAGIVTAQAGLTGPLRQPVGSALDATIGSGISAGVGVGSHQVRAGVQRPNPNPAFDRVDLTGQAATAAVNGAIDVATATAGTARGAVDRATGAALDTANQAIGTARATVSRTAGTSGANNLDIPSPIGDARWNERQLLQRTIRFDAGNLTAHTVEVRAHRVSGRMYAVQVLVDGKQAGDQVNVYSTSLHLESLDVPVFVPGAQGTIDLAVSYGYFSSGSTCLASIGVDSAPCAAAAPDPEGLVQLSPVVTTNLGWQMLGQRAGRTSIRTPLF